MCQPNRLTSAASISVLLFVSRAGVDDATKATVKKLPMLTVKAGPRDGEEWIKRMKEEYMALISVSPHRLHSSHPCLH